MESKDISPPTYSPSAPSSSRYLEANTDVPPTHFYVTSSVSLYGPKPVEMNCPYCQAHIVTHIERIAGLKPWLAGGFGMFCCLCCIPFCIPSCFDVIHSCPACKRYLGRYNRL